MTENDDTSKLKAAGIRLDPDLLYTLKLHAVQSSTTMQALVDKYIRAGLAYEQIPIAHRPHSDSESTK